MQKTKRIKTKKIGEKIGRKSEWDTEMTDNRMKKTNLIECEDDTRIAGVDPRLADLRPERSEIVIMSQKEPAEHMIDMTMKTHPEAEVAQIVQKIIPGAGTAEDVAGGRRREMAS